MPHLETPRVISQDFLQFAELRQTPVDSLTSPTKIINWVGQAAQLVHNAKHIYTAFGEIYELSQHLDSQICGYLNAKPNITQYIHYQMARYSFLNGLDRHLFTDPHTSRQIRTEIGSIQADPILLATARIKDLEALLDRFTPPTQTGPQREAALADRAAWTEEQKSVTRFFTSQPQNTRSSSHAQTPDSHRL